MLCKYSGTGWCAAVPWSTLVILRKSPLGAPSVKGKTAAKINDEVWTKHYHSGELKKPFLSKEPTAKESVVSDTWKLLTLQHSSTLDPKAEQWESCVGKAVENSSLVTHFWNSNWCWLESWPLSWYGTATASWCSRKWKELSPAQHSHLEAAKHCGRGGEASYL